MKTHQNSLTLVTKILVSFAFVAGIAGCGANAKKEIFNPNNPTMESILNKTDSRVSTYSYRAHSREEAIAHNGTVNHPQNVFRELDNPTLFLYIDPHVTRHGTYIEGITIPIKRYREVQFALPGEL